MMNSTLGERYANALLSIALEEKQNSLYREYIKNLANAIEENQEFIDILSSSFIEKEEKKNIIMKILKDCPSQNIQNFINVIIDNGRERYLLDILKNFISLSNSQDGIEEGIVYTHMKLTKEQVKDLEAAISKKINKKVYLTQRVDPSLLGGLKVSVSDFVFDASLKNKLDALKQSLEGR